MQFREIGAARKALSIYSTRVYEHNFSKFVLATPSWFVYNRGMNEYKNKRLVTLACDHAPDGEKSHFYYFLIGWMSSNHHEEMAEAARRWLHTYAPEVLQDFDRIYLDHSTSV